MSTCHHMFEPYTACRYTEHKGGRTNDFVCIYGFMSVWLRTPIAVWLVIKTSNKVLFKPFNISDNFVFIYTADIQQPKYLILVCVTELVNNLHSRAAFCIPQF